MDDFEKELKGGFLEEATQLLQDAEQCFLQLDSGVPDSANLEKIFRIAHNIKGSSKAVGFQALGDFTHEFESFLLKVKDGTLAPTPPIVSLLLRCNDCILRHINELKSNFDAPMNTDGLLDEIHAIMSGDLSKCAAPAAAEETSTAEEVEAAPHYPSADQFEPETAPAEAMAALTTENLPAAPAPAPVAAAPASAKAEAKADKKGAPQGAGNDESIRISLARLEKLLNFVGEMVILQSMLREQAWSTNPQNLRKTVHQLSKVTKEVQDISMSLRMIPLKQTFQKMQRIVRDTSSALGKKINFVIAGEETELDKTVLENLGDPLVHLVRNAVDHGIENGEARKAAGKPEAGTVHLSAFHQSGSLVIEVQDDGGGLNAEKLTKKAIEKGLLKPGTVLSEKDAYQLIFAAGFSTKEATTDISGRGVGMDVVRTNIEALQGDIQIDSTLGKGTRFRIRLPLTLAIIDALQVVSGGERYVIPLAQVHESIRPPKNDLHVSAGLNEVFSLRGEHLPLYRLSNLLGKKAAGPEPWDAIAVVVRSGDHPFAVLVDDIVCQSQVVTKKLGAEHAGLAGFSGSAILGDGRPALILELSELITRKSSNQIKTRASA
jgi:two-component system chemotaxis sensor kinase CheA